MLSQNEIIEPNWYKLGIEVHNAVLIPYSHESRFILRVVGWQVPIINIRYEAFNTIREKLEDDKVWIRIWTQIISDPKEANYWGCICDGRIPTEVYAKSLCWIGAAYPPIQIAQEICQVADLEHEIKQFTDPVSYWEKRGGIFENGSVTLPG